MKIPLLYRRERRNKPLYVCLEPSERTLVEDMAMDIGATAPAMTRAILMGFAESYRISRERGWE